MTTILYPKYLSIKLLNIKLPWHHNKEKLRSSSTQQKEMEHRVRYLVILKSNDHYQHSYCILTYFLPHWRRKRISYTKERHLWKLIKYLSKWFHRFHLSPQKRNSQIKNTRSCQAVKHSFRNEKELSQNFFFKTFFIWLIDILNYLLL